MKTCAIVFLIFASSLFAQSHFKHTFSEVRQSTGIPQVARDFWFAVPLNYDPNDNAEKTFTLYISGKKATTVHVQVSGQAEITHDLQVGETWQHVLPKSVEVKGSLDVETTKAVHVWSDEAEISVYFLSRNPFTSDGFMVLPTMFLDTSYVVTSYSALLTSPQIDLPSEICIVAPENNTLVTVRPTQNIRRTAEPTKTFHAKGTPFTITLQKGECVQLQTVLDAGGSDLDLTGTVITSNKPIGVIGASVCPMIPADPYCDHICEMLLPISKWGKTYHTLPFASRTGGDSFYIIGSKDGQSISRNGVQYATVNKYEPYFRPDISEPSVWTSDAPFMCVQYINSSRFGSSNNPGDPAMIEINPAEFAKREIVIPVPTVSGTNFTHYLNIFAPTASVESILLDGKPLATDTATVRKFTIPSTSTTGIRIRNMKPGTHSITCDSPLTAYGYGYATDDSYGWSDLGPDISAIAVTDSTPPAVVVTDSCNCTTLRFYEGHTNASGIVRITRIMAINLEATTDPAFTPGAHNDSTFIRLCGTNTLGGESEWTITDSVGNSITVLIEYTPRFTVLNSSQLISALLKKGETMDTTIALINLTGDTLVPHLGSLQGTATGFTFSPNPLPPLKPHDSVLITFHFPMADSVIVDTFVVSYDSCLTTSLSLRRELEPEEGVADTEQEFVRILSSRIINKSLALDLRTSRTTTIEIYDMLGRLRMSKSLTPGIRTETLNTPGDMEAGTYIVRFTNADTVSSKLIQVIE